MDQRTDKRDSKHPGEYFPPPENIPEPPKPTPDGPIRFLMQDGSTHVIARYSAWCEMPRDERPEACLSECGNFIRWIEPPDPATWAIREAEIEGRIQAYRASGDRTFLLGTPAA